MKRRRRRIGEDGAKGYSMKAECKGGKNGERKEERRDIALKAECKDSWELRRSGYLQLAISQGPKV